MKKLMRSVMKAQQAPTTGRSGVRMQTSRLLPVQTASMKRKRISGGTSQTISRIEINVSTMLSGVENRLARIQPIAPVMATGGGSGSCAAERTKAISAAFLASKASMSVTAILALHQRLARVVPVHEQRSRDADREIDRHRDGDDLDRLAS